MDTSYSIEQNTTRKHLRHLMHLRYLAIIGQFLTILSVTHILDIALPLVRMFTVLGALFILNLASLALIRSARPIPSWLIFAALLCDTGAFALQLYWSGGAANPFISLFLLQVIIGSLMLPPVYAWILMLLTLLCYGMLMDTPSPGSVLALPPLLYSQGALVNYSLVAALSVWFLTRISRNLKERDASYAALKQQSAEEEHIVRMGLLASGAAHELGTPLSTLSVILGDWQDPRLNVSEAQRRSDIALMLAELKRCKKIVTDILLSAGEVRGEGAASMPLMRFMDKTLEEWVASRQPAKLEYRYHPVQEHVIVYDLVLQHMLASIFDNALDASPGWLAIDVRTDDSHLTVTVEDRGAGFSPQVLEQYGKSPISTKGKDGHGMGLFLAFNTLRKLSGRLEIRNLEQGAIVTIFIPLSVIEVPR